MPTIKPSKSAANEMDGVVDDGVEVQGMGTSEPRPDYRSAAFEIPHSFFDTIKAKLSQQSGEQDRSYTPQLKDSASLGDDENINTVL